MENKTFAYVRVSSKEQNLSRQIDSMLQYVKDPRDIYCDKQSGKNFERPGYQALFYNPLYPGWAETKQKQKIS